MHIKSFLMFTGKVLLAFAVGMFLLKLLTKIPGVPMLGDYVIDPAGKLGVA